MTTESHVDVEATPSLTTRKVYVSFERKQNLGDYSSVTASAFVQDEVPLGANPSEVAEKLAECYQAAAAAVFDQLGIVFTMDEHGVIREKHAPIVTVQDKSNAVDRKFGGNSSSIKVMNPEKLKGDLPDWLITQATEAGVTAVWANWNRERGAWFKEAIPRGGRPNGDTSPAREFDNN